MILQCQRGPIKTPEPIPFWGCLVQGSAWFSFFKLGG